MKRRMYSEEDIERFMRNMPRITHDQDADELYNKISSQLHDRENIYKRKRKKRFWIIPSLASAAVVVLLSIMIQGIGPADHYSSHDSAESNSSAGQASDETMESFDIAENESSFPNDNISEQSELKTEQTLPTSNVVSEDQAPVSNIIYSAVADEQNQYAIPISIIDENVEGITDVEDYYARLNTIIHAKDWGVQPFPFDQLDFEIEKDEQMVTIHVPDTYEFPDSGSNATMFQRIISMMFHPLGINEINIDSGDRDFGMFGRVDTLTTISMENQAYKIYQIDDQSPAFIIPTSFDPNPNLESALKQMQEDEPGFHVRASIPSTIDIGVIEENESKVIVELTNGPFDNDQQTLDMIESILMAVKSFGYKEVKFEIPIDVVGPYQLNQPISMPIAVNPKIVE